MKGLLRRKKKNEPRRPLESSRVNAPVFSYSAQRVRAEENTERAVHELPKPQRNWFKLLPSLISLAVIAGSLLYATTLTSSPRVVAVEEPNNKLLRPIGFYQESFAETLEESLLNYSKLSIDTNRIAREIEQKHPELTDVAISLPLIGRRPVIQIRANPPAFILASKHGTYLIGADGRAVLHTRDADIAGLGITTVTDESGLEPSLGEIVLARDDVGFITTILYQLKSKDMIVQSITLPPISNELHMRFQGRGYYAKFNLRGNALGQAGAFVAIQERLEAENTLPNEYIDVRVEDRAYIR